MHDFSTLDDLLIHLDPAERAEVPGVLAKDTVEGIVLFDSPGGDHSLVAVGPGCYHKHADTLTRHTIGAPGRPQVAAGYYAKAPDRRP